MTVPELIGGEVGDSVGEFVVVVAGEDDVVEDVEDDADEDGWLDVGGVDVVLVGWFVGGSVDDEEVDKEKLVDVDDEVVVEVDWVVG